MVLQWYILWEGPGRERVVGGSGGSETRYQTEPPKTSHRLQQPPSYVSVRPSATTTTIFIKKLSTPTTNDFFLFPFPRGSRRYSASKRSFFRRKYNCTYVRLLMIYASSIGCCAIEWGNDGKRRAKEGRSTCTWSIVYRKLRRRWKKTTKRPRGSADLIWVGKGEEREGRERWFPWEKQVVHYTTRVSRTAPATPYSPSFTYRRSCVNVFDDLNLLKSLNRKKTDCRQTVSDCQTLRKKHDLRYRRSFVPQTATLDYINHIPDIEPQLFLFVAAASPVCMTWPRTDVLRLGVGVGCVGGTVVEIAQKRKKQNYTCLLFGRNQPNLIYKGAQTGERSLLGKRRGKKGRRKLGRQRVEKMMIVVLSPIPYGVLLF